MTMCVVVNGAKACYSFNCSCPNKRDRRAITTSEVTKKSTSKLGIMKVNCKFKIIHNESIYNIIQGNFTNIKKYNHVLFPEKITLSMISSLQISLL